MAKTQLRMNQVVGTYGPGAMVDLPDDAIIVSGLDDWQYDNMNLPTIEEPRLVASLRQILEVPTLTLRNPPHAAEQNYGIQPQITGFRFPKWYLVQKDQKGRGTWRKRHLVHEIMLENGRYRNTDGKLGTVVPIRFVRACPKGHVGDIEWRAFVHGASYRADKQCHRELWIEERGTSGDLNDVWVTCDCGLNRPMSEAARPGRGVLGSCNGSRPWLGPNTQEQCTEPNRLLIRSASNAYFPQELSVISIPDSLSGIDAVVRSAWDEGLSIVDSLAMLNTVKRIPNIAAKLLGYGDAELLSAIARVASGGDNADRSVKDVEYVALSEARQELGSDKPEGDFYARALPKDRWDAPWMSGINSVILVHRLREVVAQVGFTRFESAAPDINGDLDLEVQRAPLGVNALWLPAVENRGEGIFIEFNAEAIAEWFDRDSVRERGTALADGFAAWKKDRPQSTRGFPGLTYYMLHSFSHLLLTSIALECGYPVSSLSERIYAARDQYAVLIYTGSSDAEGTLGGLVSAGRSIARHVRRALELGVLCSNDPICANHSPDAEDHQGLLGSACHGCLLVAETCCEQKNDYMDRALVVPTIDNLGAEFFAGII